MKRFSFLIIAVLHLTFSYGQRTMQDVLTSMPGSIVPYIKAEQMAKLCKFSSERDTLKKISNSLNGETSIDTMSVTYAKIALNDMVQMQIKLLTLNDSAQIVCTIKTIRKPSADSEICFYTPDWMKLDCTFGLPSQNDEEGILNLMTVRPDTMSTDRYDELRRKIEPVMVSATFTGDAKLTITYSLSLPLLNKTEREKIKAIIKQKSFNWDGAFF